MEIQRKPKRKPRRPKTTPAAPVDPRLAQAISKVASHQMDLQKMVLANKGTANKGTFGNLGGDVDSMIEHGQEAWASIKRLLNTESKANFYSLTTAGLVPSRTWHNVDLTAQISQGVNDSQRDGDSIKCLELDFTYSVLKTGISSTAETFRLIILQSVDEAVTVADVFVDDATVLSPYSMYQWDTRKQYRVLHDEIHEVVAAAAYVDGAVGIFAKPVTRRLKIRLDNHTQFFNNGTTVEKGAIQWMCCSSQSTTNSLLFVNSRLVYVDN
jgi:hypothetical protein